MLDLMSEIESLVFAMVGHFFIILDLSCLIYVAYLCCAKSNNFYLYGFGTNYLWFCLLASAKFSTVLSEGVFFLASGDASGVEGGGHLCSMAFGFLVFFAFSVKRGFYEWKIICKLQSCLVRKGLIICTTEV